MKHNSSNMAKHKKLLDAVVFSLEEFKALNIQILPVEKMTVIADYMIVASGTSRRHVGAISEHLIAHMKTRGIKPRFNADESNEWTLIDLGDIIVHVMQQTTRDFYNLEKLWAQLEKIQTA